MLSIYRRHRTTCKFADDRISKRCHCPLWATGSVDGKPYRKTLKTRSFERAQQTVNKLEEGKQPERPKAVTVAEALDAFVRDCEARNLNPSTLAKYKLLTRRLKAYCAEHRISRLSDLTPPHAGQFRAGWKGSPRTIAKMIERFRAWGNYCVENAWITANPAKGVKPPIIKPNPTLPFSDAEVSKLLAYADSRTNVFFRVLLHSGLRIIDAAQLRPDKLQDGKLFLYVQKTGVPVRIPIPPDLVHDLGKLKLVGGFYFAVESDDPVNIAEYYRRKLTKVAIAAGLMAKKKPGAPRTKKVIHPHRFRDTFAVRLLEKGVPLETVSILLGHTDLRTTQRSYAPWVESLQDNLEKAVTAAWPKAELVIVK